MVSINALARYEVPIRAPPLSAKVALALAWYCAQKEQLGATSLILAGFDAFLRTGEMLSMVDEDVVLGPDDRGVINLGHTKTGKRHAAFEAAAFNDPMIGQVLRVLRRRLPKGSHRQHYIFPGSEKKFYQLFRDGIKWLGLDGYGFLPYSIRRGGATAFFRRTRNMEATLDRGRWSSQRVARIYVNDGLAKEVELRFPPEVGRQISVHAAALMAWLNKQ